MENRVRPYRPRDGQAHRAGLGDGGLDLAALLVAEEAVLAAMRVETRDRQLAREAEVREGPMAALEVIDETRLRDEVAGLAERHVPRKKEDPEAQGLEHRERIVDARDRAEHLRVADVGNSGR